MMLLNDKYPTSPMSAVPTVMLEAFLASEALNDDDLGAKLDEVETQRTFCLQEGAFSRARVVGGLKGHDQQAAALLSAIREVDLFLEGSLTRGGRLALDTKLDADEREAVQICRDTMAALLAWHFENGAGALLPIARYLGLVVERRV